MISRFIADWGSGHPDRFITCRSSVQIRHPLPINNVMWYVANDIDEESRYIWAESEDEAMQICKEEGFDLLGEYVMAIPTDIVN